MPSPSEIKAWTLDQISKSQFFHQKLHEWDLLEVAKDIENIRGELLEWDLRELNISVSAWNRVIHSGIKPVKVFCHPDVILDKPKRVSYYRMLAMVSQKSMSKVGLPIKEYEEGKRSLNRGKALKISRHLNKIISALIEHDNELNEREFDLWRGMAAGSQAQGSWQNIKGDRAEVLIKDLILQRLRERNLIVHEKRHGKVLELILRDGRVVKMSSEPDVGIYKNNLPLTAVEIKGGIDTAGVLERLGAALKSLGRIKHENPKATTILLMYKVSLTPQVNVDLKNNQNVVDYFFVIEKVLESRNTRQRFLNLLGI